MINFKYRVMSLLLNLCLSLIVFNEANIVLYERKSRSDDEDASTATIKNIQSSGDGAPPPPDVYPSLDPYTQTRSTATILVDVAFEHSYKSYMLPGSVMTPQLKSLTNDLIDNFKLELQNIYVKLDYQILSFRPGPLIPKKNPLRSEDSHVPSVFIRMNITQYNSSIVSPLIIFHISQCGRQGTLGNLTISEQIIFPQYVCTNKQVYCLPKCKKGAYCDGIRDCPETNLDETASCPQCLYKYVNLVPNSQILNENEELILECNFNSKCENLKQKIHWNFPLQLKSYEESYNGISRVDSLPRNLITSGIYRCIVDGESSSMNISVLRKPTVFLTKADPEAETVIISEIEGKKVDYWCNTTEGLAHWLPVNIHGVKVKNYNERSSKLSFQEITKGMGNSYHCHIFWGYKNNEVIQKTAKIIVMCDPKVHFECKLPSLNRSCIPLQQKCDSIKQCDDGSDELNCNFCSEKELSMDVERNIERDAGDTLIVECLTSRASCKPLTWWTKGKIIVTSGNIARFKDSLFIVNMQINNNGLYQCSDASNKTSINIFVHINTAPTLNLIPRRKIFNITYGKTASLTCLINFPLNVTYQKLKPYWSKEGEDPLSPSKYGMLAIDELQSRIIFNNADLSMSGVYHCQVKWGMTNKKIVRETVIVNINPIVCKSGEKSCVDKKMCLAESFWCDGKIQCQDGSDEKSCNQCNNGFVFVQPSVLTVLVGQTAELHCYYDKDCYPVKWRIASRSQPLSSGNGISIENNKLTIHNIKLNFSNIYECYSGDKISQSNLTVIQHVELKLSQDYVFMEYGQSTAIDCQSNYGQPQWRRMDLKQLSNINGALQSYPYPNVAKLFLNSPSYDAKGFYMCFVRLSQTEEDAAISRIYVHINDLKCPENNLMCDEKTKCIPKTKLCNSVRDCKNGEDEQQCSKCQDELEVRPKELIITRLGYNVFECIVPNKDCLPIEWKFKSEKRLDSSRFLKFDNSLYILYPQQSDAGEIICTSGQKSSSAVLVVKDLILTFEPNQSDDSTIYMMRGQNRRITCKSNLGTPRWIYPEESTVSMFGVHYGNIQTNSMDLDIVNIQVEASRKYVCQVSFSRESKKISLSIKVI